MKVLHVSDTGLPDVRIERYAFIIAEQGHQAFFAGGPIRDYALGRSYFVQCYSLPWSARARVSSKKAEKVRQALKEIVDEVDPDVIHAHNIFAAEVAYELGYPIVLDDDEHYSSKIPTLIKLYLKNPHACLTSLKNLTYLMILVPRCRKLERKLAERSIVIALSDTIAARYKKVGGDKVYVIPNLPCMVEVKVFEEAMKGRSMSEEPVLRMVYIGNRETFRRANPYRDITPFLRALKDLRRAYKLVIFGIDPEEKRRAGFSIPEEVELRGFVPHMKLLRELISFDVGLAPWKPNPHFKYVGLIKASLYVHGGALVALPFNAEGTRKLFRESDLILFKSIPELVERLRKLDLDEARRTRNERITWARRHLVLERYRDVLMKAYTDAISAGSAN